MVPRDISLLDHETGDRWYSQPQRDHEETHGTARYLTMRATTWYLMGLMVAAGCISFQLPIPQPQLPACPVGLEFFLGLHILVGHIYLCFPS